VQKVDPEEFVIEPAVQLVHWKPVLEFENCPGVQAEPTHTAFDVALQATSVTDLLVPWHWEHCEHTLCPVWFV
jgi:hypothetical protein